MEGLNIFRNNDWKVIGISMTLYNSNTGAPLVTSYELNPSSVRLFFTEREYEATMIAESLTGKIITWNPESDWFNEYNTIEEAANDQKKNYISYWNIPAVFTEEFKQFQ
ncbi:hypothetical protein [Paenibacillus pini]|uniref:Uncharacterized protein n=1 Tax=Paenibacillus pini JCM 16418 TaxID=1236976 RepID=W7YUD1_9BACL|nr:hypothetical protein [Paenibacillus pini]GAF10833.1 hypothetical protein JCM16418_5058 [Paenibacillus pini JCM 16418]